MHAQRRSGLISEAAESAIVVTTAEEASILSAYGIIKELAAAKVANIKIFVERAKTPHQAAEVHGRLRRTARRMLGIDLELAGYALFDARVRSAAAKWPPQVPPLRTEMSGTWRKQVGWDKRSAVPPKETKQTWWECALLVPPYNKKKKNNSTCPNLRPIMGEHYRQAICR